MQNILITGGLGYIGGRLVQSLSIYNKVWVSSRAVISSDQLALFNIEKSILHSELLNDTTFPKNIDIVIHLAALNEIDSKTYPVEAIEVNINQTRIIVENAVKTGVQKFIYFSTSHVYGANGFGEINENTIPCPIHPYAITHKAAEDYVIAAHIENKIKSVVIRLSNSFGAPLLPNVNRWTLLVNDLCKQAVINQKLELKSNGCQFRDFVCLTDVVNIISQMLNKKNQNEIVYNVGSGKSMKVKDMAEKIAQQYEELFSVKIPIYFPNNVVETVEPNFTFSTNRLVSEGFTMENNFLKEINESLIFCKKNF